MLSSPPPAAQCLRVISASKFMVQANFVVALMLSALWLMHNNITWQRFCAVVMWYPMQLSLYYHCVPFIVELDKEWQVLAVFFFLFFFFRVKAWRCDLNWRENSCCLTASHHFIYTLAGLMASVMTGVKDLGRFGHPQDNGGGEKKGQLLSRGIFYIFGIMMTCLFLACFFFLYWETATSHGQVTCPSHTHKQLLRLT